MTSGWVVSASVRLAPGKPTTKWVRCGAHWRESNVPWFAGGRGSSRRRHGRHWSHGVPDQRRNHFGALSQVMHQFDREVQPPPERTKVGQQSGHFGGVVLINALESPPTNPAAAGGVGAAWLSPRAMCGAVRDQARESGCNHLVLDRIQIQTAITEL